ncbi:ABC transporter ATP-binding protein [Actinoplanes xinjiangensis]|uniref:ATP-binding cassette subfamily B protein n=1 Tax=Actinoplanes xinjiangensis TaxID=512350 RepID=A0A316EKB7_9ACTN|nr:ABC transporter ATP-binding protein [Actinoplanes xinjiangensis]PWK31710.1 ATP-binding cassette subfamily B protein [Actinoplanes xinjiangensis]GIF43916.1 multidrug ABC transporter permease [Actinoplanes xinjiangensis]
MNGADSGARSTLALLKAAFALAWQASPWLLAARIGVALAGGLAPVAVAWLTKLLLDLLVDGGTTRAVVAVVLALAATTLVGALLPAVGNFVDAELSRRTQLAGRAQLYRAIGGFGGLGRFEDPDFQDRLQLAVSDGPATPAQVTSNGLTIAQSAVTIVGFVAALASMAPWMAVVVAVAAIPTVRAELTLSRARAAMMLQLGHAGRRELFYADLISSVTAAKEVRIYGLSDLFAVRMTTELRKINRGMRGLDLRELRMQAALTGIGAVVAGGGLVWAALSARSGRLGVGDIVVFAAATAGVQNLLASIIGHVARTHQALLIFTHFQQVVRAPADLAPLEGLPVLPVPPLRDAIELRDVWFRYGPSLPWILRGVNLTIRAGRATALVGLNGAGKSTIVKLLCRLYDPTRGAVLWDGVDLRRFPIEELRERLGAVFQDFMSYDLSAAENIGLGDVARLDDRSAIEATAERAGCHLTVEKLPRGYDTLLTRFFSPDEVLEGEVPSGVQLSGGQWQRLALARAFMRADRDLLILDEPSAGLDADAEHEVHTRLRELREGSTSVLISHRLSTVRDADTIAVLSGGVVTELGDHDTLLAAGGTYAGLFTLQASGYTASPDARAELHPSTGG